jgi:hypothetical protein
MTTKPELTRATVVMLRNKNFPYVRIQSMEEYLNAFMDAIDDVIAEKRKIIGMSNRQSKELMEMIPDDEYQGEITPTLYTHFLH